MDGLPVEMAEEDVGPSFLSSITALAYSAALHTQPFLMSRC